MSFSWAAKAISYLGGKANSAFDGLTAELTENRAILAWVYSIAYLILLRYCVVSNPATMNTALVVTGGVISTIFASYVASSSYEKVAQIKADGAALEVDPAAPGTDGPAE